jgi:glycerol uptake facilitator-like aquaporin
MVNLSKFLVEVMGTTVLGIFYLTVGFQQAGVLLGMWIITLFGVAISGAHYNPAVTLAIMMRKNSNFGSRRLLGLMYIVAQFLGGLLAASLSRFILEGRYIIASPRPDDAGSAKIFSAILSESFGSFMFVFLFMICTDRKTQFSDDKVINCFIVAGAYVASRLFAGGRMITGVYQPDGASEFTNAYKAMTGPLLNPGLAFGQMMLSFDFSYIYIYLLMPFLGTVIALVFYEFVFVKTQDYLGASEEGSENGEEDRAGKGSNVRSIGMNDESDDETEQ